MRPAAADGCPRPLCKKIGMKVIIVQHADRKSELCEIGTEVSWLAEVREVEHGACLISLDHNEEKKEDERPHPLAEDPRIGLSPMIAFDQRKRHEEKRAAETGNTRQVEAHCIRIL
jgi:hypothetical protein